MKSCYVHQWNQLSEKTADAFLATINGHFDAVRFKTHQYTTYTGHFDSGGAFDLDSLVAVADCIKWFTDRGIAVTPWCVPMGIDPVTEARFGAEVAKLAGGIDCDVEPYVEFWPDIANGRYDSVPAYFSELRRAAGASVKITLDVPVRLGHEWNAIKPAIVRALPFINTIVLQSYFGAAQAQEAEIRVRQETGWGGPLQHIVEPVQFGEMLPMLAAQNAKDVLVWRAADMNAEAYRYLDAFTYPGDTPDPLPGIEWQAPGFAGLAGQLGASVVGLASGVPESNYWGDVRQPSSNGGYMYWLKSGNENVWVAHG